MSSTPELSRRCLSVLAASAGLAITAAASAQFEFDVEPVRQDNFWNGRSSIAIDEAGVVHLCHTRQVGTDSAGSEIWYGTNAGGDWAFTQITNNAVREEFPDLTLDSAGNVHIAVHTGVTSGNKMRYTNNVSGTFFDPVDITGPGFIIVSHAIDAAGTAHLAFQGQSPTSPTDIFYATRTAAGVVTGPMNLTNSTTADGEASLALDSEGNVHIAWEKGSTLGYMNNVNGSFQEVQTGVAGFVDFPIVLVGPSNVVSIIYRESLTNGLLKIIDNAGGVFAPPEDVIPPGQYRPSAWENAAVDSAGRRYICFSSNGSTTTQGVFFSGETETGFAEPVFLGDSTLSNIGGSVAVNSSGKIVASFEHTGSAGEVFSDVFVAALRDTAFDPDLDGNGMVDVFDLLAYLDLWFVSDAAADIDDAVGVDVFDLLFFLDAWFAG